MIPQTHTDLLERPLYGHFASSRPDGSVQVNPTWYQWADGVILLTTSTTRAKYHNPRRDRRVALSINDPEQPYRYLEVRGDVTEIRPDTAGEFFDVLARRYELPYQAPVGDAADRVVLVVTPRHTTAQ